MPTYTKGDGFEMVLSQRKIGFSLILIGGFLALVGFMTLYDMLTSVFYQTFPPSDMDIIIRAVVLVAGGLLVVGGIYAIALANKSNE